MKKLPFLLLILLPVSTMLMAQNTHEAQAIGENKMLFNNFGISVGAGPAFYSLDKLNKKLEELEAPALSEGAAIGEIKLYGGGEWIMASVIFAYTNLRQQNQPSSFAFTEKEFNVAEITGLYYGIDLAKPLLSRNNFQVNFPVIGFNQSWFQLKLDSIDTQSRSVTANNLASEPSKLYVLKNNENKNIRAGAELLYVVDFKSYWNLKFGLSSGYNLPVINNEWTITNRNNTVVPDFPKITKGNLYILFSFGTSFKIGNHKDG